MRQKICYNNPKYAMQFICSDMEQDKPPDFERRDTCEEKNC